MTKNKLSICFVAVFFLYQPIHAQQNLASLEKPTTFSTCDIMLDSLPKTPWPIRLAALQSVAACVKKGSSNEARLCRQYALYYFNAANYKEAIEWSNKEKHVYEQLGEQKKALGAELISTQFYMSFGDNFRAHRIAKAILWKARQMGDSAIVASAYISMGMSSGDLNMQKRYYQKAIQCLASISPTNPVSMGTAHNNLASVFEEQHNLDSAYHHYHKALFYKKKNGRATEVAFNTFANLAKIQIKRGQHRLALLMLDTAFATAQRQGIMLGYYHVPLLLRKTECAVTMGDAQMSSNCFKQLDSLMKTHPPYTPNLWNDYFSLHKTLAFQQRDLANYQYWDKRFTAFSDSMSLHRDSVFASNLGILREIEATEAEANQLRQASRFRIAVIGALLLLLLSTWEWMRQRIRRKQLLLDYAQQQQVLMERQRALESLELSQLKTEAELRETKQKSMEDQLEYANRQLTAYTVLMAKKGDFMRELGEQLQQAAKYSQVRQEEALRKIIHTLALEQTSEAEWEQFQHQFEAVHPTFFQQLRVKFDKITTHDLKLCAFIKMQLDNKDISKLMGINPASVLTSRYRLRKKMGLGEHEDLDTYLMAL